MERDAAESYQQQTIRTAAELRTVATTSEMLRLSQLDLPEIERITQEVARVVPAGNVPGMILGGLARMEGRKVDASDSRKYIDLLFRGVKMSMDMAVLGVFFAGPAAVLYAFQQILRLAGKDPDSAFPDGTWQFYLEFALREDAARHANETTGFHAALDQDRLNLPESDQLAAWMLTAAHTVRQLPDMLANEWRERTVLRLLASVAETHAPRKADDYRRLYTQWEGQRPYNRRWEDSFAVYRRKTFDAFWQPYLGALPARARDEFTAQLREQEAERLPAFQTQMSWLAYLKPEAHNEVRVHYPFGKALIAVIYARRYYLVPLADCMELNFARHTAAAILANQPRTLPAVLDELLVAAPRSENKTLRAAMDAETQRELEYLRHAPIIINWDEADLSQPLAYIRRGKRGIGDHALTIFRTRQSIVFDQSHIFFDGTWGAAMSEIMTNEAVRWAGALVGHSPASGAPVVEAPYSPALQAPPKLVKSPPRGTPEACAENTGIALKPVISLRKLLKQRSDALAQVTVNDLLILYRGLHAQLYRPSARLQAALDALARDNRAAAQKAYQAVADSVSRAQGRNPAILIPIDASRFDPRERVYPTTFRNPLSDFLDHHRSTVAALKQSANGDRRAFQTFQEAQKAYLGLLGGFGTLMQRYKEIALGGGSTSTASIRFLAHMPGAIQKLLNNIPGKFDLLNEIIKGEEVFSNLGRVASGSTLQRFITAKDDNDQKTLSWAVITDDHAVMHISLRDFRPHVRVLQEAGLAPLAQLVVQDYLDAFVEGFNVYIEELRAVTVATSETRPRFGLFGR